MIGGSRLCETSNWDKQSGEQQGSQHAASHGISFDECFCFYIRRDLRSSLSCKMGTLGGAAETPLLTADSRRLIAHPMLPMAPDKPDHGGHDDDSDHRIELMEVL